jgi:hypothetical protein
MPLYADCSSLFLDPSNQLFCSEGSRHRVVKMSLQQSSSEVAVVAGTGCWGSGVYELNTPQGIFVSSNQDLYVADCGNNRVQRFRLGELNGTTVAGNGVSGTISLSGPTSIIIDADGYLFISDKWNNRVVGSGPFGFRCIVGCLGGWNSTSAHLNSPTSISFDRLGNLYVADQFNNRTQKFSILNNTCGESRWG